MLRMRCMTDAAALSASELQSWVNQASTACCRYLCDSSILCILIHQACCLHASIVAYAAVDCCSFIMHYTCDRYTLTKRMITAGMYNFAGNCMKSLFTALQLLQMMQQPNRYEGIGNHVKAHRPEQCDEPAKRRTKQEAKKKAISSAERIGSKASSSSAHQPNAQADKAGRSRGQRLIAHVARSKRAAGRQEGCQEEG